MNTISRKQILGFTAFSVIAALVFAAVRVLVSMNALESGIEMYAHGTQSAVILHIAIAAACAVVCFSGVLKLDENPAAADLGHVSQFTTFSSMFCGFMLLAYDLIIIYDAAMSDWEAIGPLIGRAPTVSVTMASAVFTLCLMIVTIPAAVYFFKAASADTKPSLPIFSTMAILWFILFTLHAYFDASTAFNSPTKVFRILAMVALMLHAIQETRRILGIPLPRIYFPTAFFAVLLGGTHAISDAVLYAMGKIALHEGYLGVAVEAAYVLYVISRLLYLGTAKGKKNTDAPADA